MLEHFALRWAKAHHSLVSNIEWLLRVDKEDRNKPLNERVISHKKMEMIAHHALQLMLVELERMKFPPDLQVKARRLWTRFSEEGHRAWTAERVLDALTDLNGEIQRELEKHRFAHLGSGIDGYFENDYLFGSDVHDKFRTARKDIKDAGNCFAMELYTASVFHLMRVAEHGLRVIAKRTRVTIKDHGVNIPLQFGDWNKVITAIKTKIDTSRNAPANAKREARLNYYSDALDRSLAMKELFRNPVSHTRTTYGKGKALDAMERVQKFMEFLARPIPR